MASADVAAVASDRLLELVGCLERQEGFAEVVDSLSGGQAATLDGVWGSSCALAAAALAAHAPAALVVICPQVDQVDELIDDLALFTRLKPDRFPAWDAPGRGDPRRSVRRADATVERARARVGRGHSCREKGTGTIGAKHPSGRSGKWCLSPFPAEAGGGQHPKPAPTGSQPRNAQAENPRASHRGRDRRAGVGRWLVESGLVSTPAVDLPGEFAVRGGIVDIFAPDWDEPVRVEFFGDQIESIRRFEIASQRSLASLRSIEVTILGPSAADRSHLADYLPPQSWFMLLEPMELEHQGRQYLERMGQGSEVRGQGSGVGRIGSQSYSKGQGSEQRGPMPRPSS